MKTHWKHPEVPRRKYQGKYKRIGGKRHLYLSWTSSNGKETDEIKFTSHQDAKRFNWEKIEC